MPNEVRPIDANATIEALRANFQQAWYGCEEPGYQIAEETASEMPTISPSPAHIDREAWNCDLCNSGNLQHAGFDDRIYLSCGSSRPPENERFRFCPKCGRPLTEEAWAELEKRLRG